MPIVVQPRHHAISLPLLSLNPSMVKRQLKGRARHSCKPTSARKLRSATHVSSSSKSTRVGKGHLYSHSSQHLTTTNPNTVFISITTPTEKLLSYCLTRLSVLAEMNQTVVPNNAASDSTTTTTQSSSTAQFDNSYQTLVLLGANSAIQRTVTILEILKRRVPSLLYKIDIGTLDNTNRTAIATKKQSSSNSTPPADINANKNSVDDESEESKVDAPKHGIYAYGIKVTLLVQAPFTLEAE